MEKIFFLILTFIAVFPAVAKDQSEWMAGTGICDITGPAGGVVTMGYADPDHKTMGIHTRLFSRAFVFKLKDTIAVFVSADIGMISQSVKLEVVNRLQEKFGKQFDDSNVMLTATHTHAGPGGYFTETLYTFASAGFNQRNFENIVSGIVKSIVDAVASIRPTELGFSDGELLGAQFNQSQIPYNANPDAGDYVANTNPVMSQISLKNLDGTPRALINWFAVHPTNMSKNIQLESGDNKAIASFQAEQTFLHQGAGNFIAAFANSDEGDISADIFPKDSTLNDLEKTSLVGELQFQKSLELWNRPNSSIDPVLQMVHAWVKMPGLKVESQFTQGAGEQVLCPSSLGYSFAAGSEDGPSGMPYFFEGMTVDVVNSHKDFPFKFLSQLTSFLLSGTNQALQKCHYPKPILINTGNRKKSWTPVFLPFQIFRIGKLAILGLPGEITTMASRRLKNTVAEILTPMGIEKIIIAGLANSYSEYITTYEEYQLQHYEGASTLFGPHTAAAYRQIFYQLAQSLDGTSLPFGSTRPGPTPPMDLSNDPPATVDKAPEDMVLAQVITAPKKTYHRGETIKIDFQGANPNNDFQSQQMFLELQKQTTSGWNSVMTEKNPDLIFHWQPQTPCHHCSVISAELRSSSLVDDGVYRLLYHGQARISNKKPLMPITGQSPSFVVRSL